MIIGRSTTATLNFLVISEYYGNINIFCTPKSINLNSPSLKIRNLTLLQKISSLPHSTCVR